ncbi:hypothetical protein LZ30DRAFT_743250 [Colletotrichum cereale]|nr:hypothetical protein LZ30DRAFT_743250 [Colletotrichum cereale]
MLAFFPADASGSSVFRQGLPNRRVPFHYRYVLSLGTYKTKGKEDWRQKPQPSVGRSLPEHGAGSSEHRRLPIASSHRNRPYPPRRSARHGLPSSFGSLGNSAIPMNIARLTISLQSNCRQAKKI